MISEGSYNQLTTITAESFTVTGRDLKKNLVVQFPGLLIEEP